MKTININLIGDLNRAPEYNKTVIRKDDLDAATRIIILVFLVAIFIVFTSSFGIWFITNNLSGKQKVKLEKLQTQHNELLDEQTKLQMYRKNLQDQMEIANYKMLIKKQINSTYIPWSLVLKDIASKIPGNIIIFDINKIITANGSKSLNKLKISGAVPVKGWQKSEIKPLTSVSLLIFNINEDKNSFLYNSEIKKIEYKKETGMYEFEIEASVKTPAEINIIQNQFDVQVPKESELEKNKVEKQDKKQEPAV
ncbi:MAG TPA: hypothetical protein P5556_00235 [Candidatus Gastranaerophilales bacterium]|nr:hypothetical protein [Candidatus Gastranaerophilales bacterium]